MQDFAPKIYTASKVHRAVMWRTLRNIYRGEFHFNSTWINEDITPLDDADVQKCKDGWIRNIKEASTCDFLICYAEKYDALSGTLVEIGAALACGNPVYLLGNCDRFSTWKHHPLVVIPELSDQLPLHACSTVLNKLKVNK